MYTDKTKVKNLMKEPYPSDSVIEAKISEISRLIDGYALRYRLWSEDAVKRSFRGSGRVIDIDNIIISDDVLVEVNGEEVSFDYSLPFMESASQIILEKDVGLKDKIEVTARYGVIDKIAGTDIEELCAEIVSSSLQNGEASKETIGRYSVEYKKGVGAESGDSLLDLSLLDKYMRIVL